MVKPTCTDCGLPDELCVCEDIGTTESEVKIDVDEREYGKKMTVISGFDSDVDTDELLTELQQRFGAGGTLEQDELHLQGDQVSRSNPDLVEILEDRGFDVNVVA